MKTVSSIKMALWSMCAAGVLLGATIATAQIDSRSLIEDVFHAGLASFREGRYAEALSSFEVIIAGTTRNHRTTAAYVMAAKAGIRAGDYDRARRHASELLDRYPRTSYHDIALYLRALAEYRLGHFDIAASDLMTLTAVDSTSDLSLRSEKLLDDILSSHLPAPELRRLSNLDLRESTTIRVTHALAKALAREGADSLAVGVLASLLDRPLPDSVRSTITLMMEDLAGGEKIKIAALLPMMEGSPAGDIRRLSGEVLDGIRFAAEEHNRAVQGTRQVELLLRDTALDSAKSAAQVVKLASLAGVRAIVGPLFTGEFTAAALVANDRYLPIISPTATGDGIAGLGPYIFQANPDYATRGRAAARYAVESLGMSSFAIMASDDIVGRSHATAFREEAGRLGATVYCEAFFPPESEDLRESFMKVRRSVMAESTLVRLSEIRKPANTMILRDYGIDTIFFTGDSGRFHTVDTAGPGGADFISVTTLFGPRGYVIAESLGLPIAIYDTTADETDIPLVALDALFMALGDPRQLDYIAPQLNYFNIRAQVIGNNEWYDPDRLAGNRDYIEGALFISDSYIDAGDSSIAGFASEFSSRRGRDPTKFTYYGYDAMSLLLDRIRDGSRSRIEISRSLAGVTFFNGLHSRISLSGGRVNGSLHLLRFKGGRVMKFGEVSGKR